MSIFYHFKYVYKTETSHLSVSLYTDDENGPKLSSYLGQGSNGTVKMVKIESDEKVTKCDESSSIIGISRLDVLKDGNEEVVICTANGLTHIVSTKINQDIIRYHHKKGKNLQKDKKSTYRNNFDKKLCLSLTKICIVD